MVLVALVGIMLSGCSTLRDDGSPLTDNELSVSVMTRLDDDPVTAPYDFGITVMDGVVYLKGHAPAGNMIRARAVSVALGTPGVVEVVDELYPPSNGAY